VIYPVDIVIPVWNRPVETRACLASLASNSPDARLIMVNYGSERETERILEEFADALDERAILVSTERNIGRVAALNLGIGLAAAPVVVIAQYDLTVGPGWLDPLMKVMSGFPDVGLAIPSHGEGRKSPLGNNLPYHEVDHGSMGIMALRREMFVAIGGLDTEMDGGVWCLRDYSRRATRAGFRTVCIPSCRLSFGEPQLLGSVARREERIHQGEQMYLRRWGRQEHFCISAVGQSAGLQLVVMVPLIILAARQGHMVHILTDKGNIKIIGSIDEPPVHDSIVFEVLPKLFTGRALKKRIDRLKDAFPDTSLVDCDSAAGPEAAAGSPVSFAVMVEAYQQKYYGEKGGADAG